MSTISTISTMSQVSADREMVSSGQGGESPDGTAEPTWDIALLWPGQGCWTEDDYLALAGNRLVELSDGSVEVLPMPTDSHQATVAYLYTALHSFVLPRGLGKVRFAPLRLRLWAGKFREPDLLFLRTERDEARREQYWDSADIVMEVVSNDDRRRDLVVKRAEYARAGIAEYWIVDPLEQRITVLRREGEIYAVHGEFEAGATATSALIPDFHVAVTAALNGSP